MACCKKVFVLPTFNIYCHIHDGGVMGPGTVRISAQPCALQFGIVGGENNQGVTVPSSFNHTMYLLLPQGVDIRSWVNAVGGADWVECPAASGRWYFVCFVDDMWKGYPTEHRIAMLQQQRYPNPNGWGTPMP